MHHRLIIIGSGPAGLTAAIYTARADLAPLVLMGPTPGGQLMWTSLVENYPGFEEGIQGPDLMMAMMNQAKKYGADLQYEDAATITGDASPFTVTTKSGAVHTADALIIATGSSPQTLGIPGEKEYVGKGVSTCATCDASFFRDKSVGVVGGGDAAMEEALVLSKYASSVVVYVRRDALRASTIMAERAKQNPKISFAWNTEVIQVTGDQFVTGVRIKNNKTNEEADVPLSGLFLALGHTPNTACVEGFVELTDHQTIASPNGVSTSKEMVFVAGDVEDTAYRQAITAAGAGCRAALQAERALEGNRV